MAISTAELVGKVKGLQQTSESLANQVTFAEQDLRKSIAVLSVLTKGSSSGEDATRGVIAASDSVNKAILSLKELGRLSDVFIRNAVK